MSNRDTLILGTAATLIVGGLPLLFSAQQALGLSMIGMGLVALGFVVVPAVLRRRASRRVAGPVVSVAEMVRWLHDRADYGTTNIQNAKSIRNGEDVVRILRPRFDAWEGQAEDGVRRHCLDSDYKDIQYLDTFTPRGFGGVTAEHAHIKEMTAELVQRLRRLAGRLEREETHLR